MCDSVSFAPSALVPIFAGYPRLAPWAAFFRRFAAGEVPSNGLSGAGALDHFQASLAARVNSGPCRFLPARSIRPSPILAELIYLKSGRECLSAVVVTFALSGILRLRNAIRKDESRSFASG